MSHHHLHGMLHCLLFLQQLRTAGQQVLAETYPRRKFPYWQRDRKSIRTLHHRDNTRHPLILELLASSHIRCYGSFLRDLHYCISQSESISDQNSRAPSHNVSPGFRWVWKFCPVNQSVSVAQERYNPQGTPSPGIAGL